MKNFISSSLNKDLKTNIKLAESINVNLEISRFGDIETLDSDFNELLKTYKSTLTNFKGELSLHAFFLDLNPVSQDPKIREVTVNRYNKSLEIAKSLNAKTIVFHSGFNGLVKHPVYFKNFMKDQISFWSDYIKEFEKHGITAALENTYENDPQILLDIINSVNSDNLKICIDTGHVNINSEFSVVEWIEKIGDKLHHMHLHNNFGQADEHNSMLKGTIDFNAVLNSLETNNLKPNLVAEIFNEKEALESVDYINRIKIGVQK